MAEVDSAPRSQPWTSAQTLSQFGAITTLRWHMFRNSLRRKGGMGDLIAIILMVPVFVAIIILPAAGALVGSFYVVRHNHIPWIAFILWVIFALCQLTSIQLGQPGTTFDPTQLIRFPLNFRGYAVIRTFFGLISPSNAITTLMSLTTAVGITAAAPGLWFYTFAAMIAFALANIFFTRMVFAWIDRWLSTRRARELFTGFIVVASLGFQYLNFTFNPGFNQGRHAHAVNAIRIAKGTALYHSAQPVLGMLPPGLAANSIVAAQAGRLSVFAAEVGGILLFAAVFFGIFAVRLYKEFRGENLSDVANAVAKTPAKKQTATPSASPSTLAALPPASARFSMPDTVAAVFHKEFITLRRNTGVFYSLVAPLAMVIFFVNVKGASLSSGILFPAAVAYTMMGIAPLCYNSLGLEAAGIQFYFLAPVKMRDVFLAKNLINIILALIEIVAVFISITYATHAPSATLAAAVLLWATFTMFISMAMGNRRSVTAPKKIDLSKMTNKQASPLSALLSIGLLLLSGGLGAGIMFLANYLQTPWILLPSTLALAIIGFFVYHQSLNSLDKLLAEHRDTLSETLCKA